VYRRGIETNEVAGIGFEVTGISAGVTMPRMNRTTELPNMFQPNWIMKRFHYLILILLLPSGVLHAAQPEKKAITVRIDVEPDIVLSTIAEEFIGFGYETSAMARDEFFSAQNTHMVQLYRTLSKSGLVRIGGIIGDHTRYEPNGTPVGQTQRATTVINRASLEKLAAFLRATGWRAMWTLNLGTGSKEEAMAEAQAVSEALGDRLQSFEIGNEVNNLKKFKSYDDYHRAYADYKGAIRAALPKALFSGPDTTGGAMEWLANFAQSESRDMSLLITHHYCGGAKSPKATIQTMLADDSSLDSKLKELERISNAQHVTFRINEVNSFSGGGKVDVSDTFASALWCLDFMFRVASHGGAGVNMETDVNQLGFVSHYSPIYRDESGQLTARPEYYGMLAFSMAGQGKVVKLTASETPANFSTFATRAPDGSVWVAIVNRDIKLAANIHLHVPAKFNTAGAYWLNAPSVESKVDVRLAGTQVTAEGTWVPGPAESVSIWGGDATIDLPATSAVLLRLR
jgi:hypothetical protein